ncbi:hypothetical protein [Aquisalinus flavus]|uniref:hypothetical protein n=1 Tax=Aquisalinus flavus TaxID=1526572 RepID=UPI00165FACC2|nr:hypothetical protein [Aquisalinus flavus]MBD0425489.1 hypothetical protein [Aquisalinus flavus]UNE48879.1 hypothetical protein FF099_12870 [Aquisalinus flavus]
MIDALSANTAGDIPTHDKGDFLPDIALATWFGVEASVRPRTENRYAGAWWLFRPDSQSRKAGSQPLWNISLMNIQPHEANPARSEDILPKFEFFYRQGESADSLTNQRKANSIWEYSGRLMPTFPFLIFLGARSESVQKYPVFMRWQKSRQADSGEEHETEAEGQISAFNSGQHAISSNVYAYFITESASWQGDDFNNNLKILHDKIGLMPEDKLDDSWTGMVSTVEKLNTIFDEAFSRTAILEKID